jgi:hypothetical protein
VKLCPPLPLALALTPLLLLAAAPARAENFPVEIVGALAPEKKTDGAAAVTLVGRSGQIYAPAGAGVWRRREAGGIATDVTAAIRRTSGPAKVTAVWAASGTSILVAGADGTLARFDRGRLTPVRTGLPADDPIALLIGAAPNQVYGRTQGGAWLRIDRAGTARVTLAQELTGFEEQAAGLGPDGALWLAGSVPADAGARRTLLARADKIRLLAADALAAPADGDRYAVVWGTAATGELLVATRAGALRLRARDGTWTEGHVSGELPSAPVRRGAGPARAR